MSPYRPRLRYSTGDSGMHLSHAARNPGATEGGLSVLSQVTDAFTFPSFVRRATRFDGGHTKASAFRIWEYALGLDDAGHLVHKHLEGYKVLWIPAGSQFGPRLPSYLHRSRTPDHLTDYHTIVLFQETPRRRRMDMSGIQNPLLLLATTSEQVQRDRQPRAFDDDKENAVVQVLSSLASRSTKGPSPPPTGHGYGLRSRKSLATIQPPEPSPQHSTSFVAETEIPANRVPPRWRVIRYNWRPVTRA
ncbi:unnamed protein product [Cyclocybe aegerita]|uniref:Uncharacterized protein n=1 Tax=Cyclocybe aegerita TaxID=1973307 RepID=A0A8S0XJ14_CYCAE|nr:unnamed protein product [Cyclocybe aegerita]